MSVPTVNELKSHAISIINSDKETFIDAAKTVYEIPETGFNEVKTSKFIDGQLRGLGFSVQTGIAKTGLKATITGKDSGPTIAVIAELDALNVPMHLGADTETGAAHACRHHAQIGILLGVAAALRGAFIKNSLSGKVVLIATPAEEFIEIQERLNLRKNSEIEFLSGKQEMIRLGTFDDVDMAMMVHTAVGSGTPMLNIGGTSNAHVSHQVRYIGKSSHAGGAPDQGINALQAAMFANSAINTQRETFREMDVARVHGIISRGGVAVNAVPDDILYEGRVRAKSLNALDHVSKQVIRCYKAGALSVGGTAEILEIAGYHPLRQDSNIQEIFVSNARSILGKESIKVLPETYSQGGSTDMGDLSCIMPVIHPYAISASGVGHGADYIIEDYDRAVIAPAKVVAATVIDLLANGASAAKKVIDDYSATYSRDNYVALQRAQFRIETYNSTLI